MPRTRLSSWGTDCVGVHPAGGSWYEAERFVSLDSNEDASGDGETRRRLGTCFGFYEKPAVISAKAGYMAKDSAKTGRGELEDGDSRAMKGSRIRWAKKQSIESREKLLRKTRPSLRAIGEPRGVIWGSCVAKVSRRSRRPGLPTEESVSRSSTEILSDRCPYQYSCPLKVLRPYCLVGEGCRQGGWGPPELDAGDQQKSRLPSRRGIMGKRFSW